MMVRWQGAEGQDEWWVYRENDCSITLDIFLSYSERERESFSSFKPIESNNQRLNKIVESKHKNRNTENNKYTGKKQLWSLIVGESMWEEWLVLFFFGSSGAARKFWKFWGDWNRLICLFQLCITWCIEHSTAIRCCSQVCGGDSCRCTRCYSGLPEGWGTVGAVTVSKVCQLALKVSSWI